MTAITPKTYRANGTSRSSLAAQKRALWLAAARGALHEHQTEARRSTSPPVEPKLTICTSASSTCESDVAEKMQRALRDMSDLTIHGEGFSKSTDCCKSERGLSNETQASESNEQVHEDAPTIHVKQFVSESGPQGMYTPEHHRAAKVIQERFREREPAHEEAPIVRGAEPHGSHTLKQPRAANIIQDRFRPLRPVMRMPMATNFPDSKMLSARNSNDSKSHVGQANLTEAPGDSKAASAELPKLTSEVITG